MPRTPTTVVAVRKTGLDKFYTIPTVAQKCLDDVARYYDWDRWDLVIEPSAGNGSFLTRIPDTVTHKIGIDIEPEHPDIVKKDFFTYSPPPEAADSRNILVVGNPPFGKVSSQAIRFFNHAATFAQVIAFILPRTFRRISIQNKLDKRFHIVYDCEIATSPCAFDPKMMVKCCFQIWERREETRGIVQLATSHSDWKFLAMGSKDAAGQPTPPASADFAIRAYGGKCGEIVRANLSQLRPKSWHWIKSNIDIDTLIERFSKLDYKVSNDTARQNSIGRGELVKLYDDTIRDRLPQS